VGVNGAKDGGGGSEGVEFGEGRKENKVLLIEDWTVKDRARGARWLRLQLLGGREWASVPGRLEGGRNKG